jgi:hypothetical protein
LASEEYIPLTAVMENFVILRKNPDYEPEKEKGHHAKKSK